MSAPWLFTVDVEPDWGEAGSRGVDAVLPRLLEVLDARGVPATFFVVGALAERVRPVLLPDGAHEIGAHGHTHRVLTRLRPAERAAEVVRARRALAAVGYDVRGFRAPYLRAPRSLPQLLHRSGYRYDASRGSVLPGLGNASREDRPASADAVARLRPAALRDRLTPFSLTWLRLLGAAAMPLLPSSCRPAVFFCHLHELLPAVRGSSPLRRLRAHGTGPRAWDWLARLLDRQEVWTTVGQGLDLQA